MIYGRGKSDNAVVPTKISNKTAQAVAEILEERASIKEHTTQQTTSRRQSRIDDVSNALDRVRELARRDRKLRFTSLYHHLTLERLRESFYGLKRRAAVGIDNVSWCDYHDALEDNLRDLYERLHRGAYMNFVVSKMV